MNENNVLLLKVTQEYSVKKESECSYQEVFETKTSALRHLVIAELAELWPVASVGDRGFEPRP